MPEFLDHETLLRILQSGTILLVAYLLFIGLRGRAHAFAKWANLPRLAFTPVLLTLRYGILVVAILLVLGRWGFQVDTLLAVLGTVLGLVAIGFVAVWSVLSNFLCAFVLVLFKPFAVGDELELTGGDGVKGRVIDMSLLFTTLEVGPGETILVPNNTFFQRIFRRRVGTVTVGLDYQLRQERPMQAAGEPVSQARPAA
jgi:Small-conductance mechanosensitive channel